jgi:hypothetical protein
MSLPTTEQDQIRKLKRALIMSLIVIVFIGGMLAYNMQKIKEYRTISAGNYITVDECNALFSKGLYGAIDIGINMTPTNNG